MIKSREESMEKTIIEYHADHARITFPGGASIRLTPSGKIKVFLGRKVVDHFETYDLKEPARKIFDAVQELKKTTYRIIDFPRETPTPEEVAAAEADARRLRYFDSLNDVRKAAVIEIIRRLGYDGWRNCEPVYTLVSQGQNAINKGNWGWGEECFDEAAEYLLRHKPYVRKVGARRARHVAGMLAFCEEGVEFKPRKSIS
jgi:hypothetical protein